MTQTTEVQNPTLETQSGETHVSNNKFHRVFGRELCVSLEATLDSSSSEELQINPELYDRNQDLIFRKGNCWRVSHPARVNGDVSEQDDAEIQFLPWFSGPPVLFYRLCFRLRPITGNIFPWFQFGRFGEEKSFGFNPKYSEYLALDFFSKRTDEFVPIFVKFQVDKGFIYFVIEGRVGESGAALKIRRVAEFEVPPHLASAKP